MTNRGDTSDLDAALGYLESVAPRGTSRHKCEYVFGDGIERTAHLLELIDGGACRDKSVVVAGTKGKGSTVALIASILVEAGYRVGMFTGPHLHSCCERFQINGRMIPEDELAAYIFEAKRAIESNWSKQAIGTPTKFEILTAIALRYFDDADVDYAVLEVGIGGRHDAVNVANPLVSVITSISLEHTAMLGSTLTEIAYAKAGIVRPNGVVVSAPQPAEAEGVIDEVCSSLEARRVKIGVDWDYVPLDHPGDENYAGQHFRVVRRGDSGSANSLSAISGHDLFIPLLGAHQLENAAVAVATVDAMGVDVTVMQVGKGLESVVWPGRLEIVSTDPLTVVDGAHNPYSMQKLAEALQSDFRYDRLILVLGISSDKDIAAMLGEVCPLADELFITQFDHPRSASVGTIAELLPQDSPRPHIVASVGDAVSAATAMAGEGDLVCITGSLYLVAQARQLFPVGSDLALLH